MSTSLKKLIHRFRNDLGEEVGVVEEKLENSGDENGQTDHNGVAVVLPSPVGQVDAVIVPVLVALVGHSLPKTVHLNVIWIQLFVNHIRTHVCGYLGSIGALLLVMWQTHAFFRPLMSKQDVATGRILKTGKD